MSLRADTIDVREVRSLLDRLDPEPLEPCGIEGCEHHRRGDRRRAAARTPERAAGTGRRRARPRETARGRR